MRKDLEHSIDRDEWEPTVAGRRLRFLEMSSSELKRYAQRLEDQYERAVAIIAEQPHLGLDKVAEMVLEREDEYFLWICNLHAPTGSEVDLEWVRAELTCGIRRRLLSGIDRLNYIEEQSGNWERLQQEGRARRVGSTLPTSLEPGTASIPD